MFSLISPEFVHDAEVFSLRHDRASATLLMLAATGWRQVTIAFRDVLTWELSPFLDQNVLFELCEYSQTELEPNSLSQPCWDSLGQGKRYFYLEPSLGLGGYVIADDVIVTVLED